MIRHLALSTNLPNVPKCFTVEGANPDYADLHTSQPLYDSTMQARKKEKRRLVGLLDCVAVIIKRAYNTHKPLAVVRVAAAVVVA